MNDDILMLIYRELKALRLEVIAMRSELRSKESSTKKAA